MQILPENVKILTSILHDFCLNFTVRLSFQTIYSIDYGRGEHSRPLLDQNFEKFRGPPSVY